MLLEVIAVLSILMSVLFMKYRIHLITSQERDQLTDEGRQEEISGEEDEEETEEEIQRPEHNDFIRVNTSDSEEETGGIMSTMNGNPNTSSGKSFLYI